MKLLTSLTPIALWHEIIHEAEADCTISLKEELEFYLVNLLMRYTTRSDFIKETVALQFLRGVDLQEVGDQCLLFSGLFPKISEKRLVKISYFVNLGQASYARISKHSTDLYSGLAEYFVPLMDVLQSVRHDRNMPDLLPLQAYELWNETGSQRALTILNGYTQQNKH